LWLGWLAGYCYPFIETTPVVDSFRVGHGTPYVKLKSSARVGVIIAWIGERPKSMRAHALPEAKGVRTPAFVA
jgi:hypothetical protein